MHTSAHEEQGAHSITYQIYETHDVPNSHDGTSKRTYLVKHTKPIKEFMPVYRDRLKYFTLQRTRGA